MFCIVWQQTCVNRKRTDYVTLIFWKNKKLFLFLLASRGFTSRGVIYDELWSLLCDFFSQKSMFLAIFWGIWQGRDSHSGLQCRYWSVIYIEDVWLPRCRVSRLVWSSCQALLLVQHIVILQCMEVICCVRRRAAVWIHVGGYGSRNSTFKDRGSRYVGHVLSQGSRLVCSDWSDLLC